MTPFWGEFACRASGSFRACICCRNDCIGHARRSRLQHDRLWRRRGRRKPQGRDHTESAERHRRTEGAVPQARLDPISEEQSVHARRRRRSARSSISTRACRSPPRSHARAAIVRVSVGATDCRRRRSRHGQARPPFADHRQRRMGRHLHVGWPAADARRSGARSDPVARRDEHAARQAHGSGSNRFPNTSRCSRRLSRAKA